MHSTLHPTTKSKITTVFINNLKRTPIYKKPKLPTSTSTSFTTSRSFSLSHLPSPFHYNTLNTSNIVPLHSTYNTSSRNSLNTISSSFPKQHHHHSSSMDKASTTKHEHEHVCSYHCLLSDMKSIFGNDLEHLNEDVLFGNLDDTSTKCLIKGLLMLTHDQDKELSTLNTTLTQMSTQHVHDIQSKQNAINIMISQLNKMNNNLISLYNDSEKVIQRTQHE